MKKNFLFLFIFIVLNAQTGPGGIGTTDGSSHLSLWLKTSSGLSGNISAWADQSGYGNNAVPTNSPNISSNVLNTFDVVYFDGSDDDLKVLNNPQLNFGTGAFSILMVYRASMMNSNSVLIDKREKENNNGWLLKTGNGDPSQISFQRSRIFNDAVVSNAGAILQNQWQILQVISDGINIRFYVNGADVGNGTIPGSNLATNDVGLTIGEKNYESSSAKNFEGDIAEIILFSKELNEAERLISESYLGNKYNISVATDLYNYEFSHQHDIVGIGETPTGDIHLTSKTSDLILSSAAVSGGQWFSYTAGHDNENNSVWSDTETPSGALYKRIAREWRFTKMGSNTPNINLSVPVSSFPSKPNAKYYLLSDTDGNFSSDAKMHLLTSNGQNYELNNFNIANGSYITFLYEVPIPNQPTNLNTAYSSPNISGNFTPATGSAEGYLVIRTINEEFEALPINGKEYLLGENIENGEVVSVGASTSFSDTGFPSGSTVHYYIYSYNGDGNERVYNTINPLFGTESIPSTAMTYVSSTTTHPSSNIVIPGHTDQTILGIEIVTTGDTNPISVTNFNFSTNGGNGTGTDDAATNLVNARLYYTGTKNPFEDQRNSATQQQPTAFSDKRTEVMISEYSDSYYSFREKRWVIPNMEKEGSFTSKRVSMEDYDAQFGSTVSRPTNVFSFLGSQELEQGTNYFFLTYDIDPNANDSSSQRIDATCASILFDGPFVKVPENTSPEGSRLIASYAQSRSKNYNFEHITRVQFAGIDNPSVGSKYTDYTSSDIAEVVREKTFDLSTYIVTDGNTARVIAWIDWNNDGDFNDPNEEYQIGEQLGTEGPHTIPITVPSDAVLGTTRMRVSLKYASFPTNSEVFKYGEVEDYAVTVSKPSTMSYLSSTVTQNSNPIKANQTDQHILGIEIVTRGTDNPLVVNEFIFDTEGSTNPINDISNAKIYYTGNSNSSFSAVNQFGSTISAPNGTHSINGSQVLGPGTNYFWLTFDTKAGATLKNVIDAFVSSIKINTAERIPTVSSPAGNREINIIYNLSSQTVSNLSGVLYDDGGISGNYNDATDIEFVIAPPTATQISLEFSDFHYHDQANDSYYNDYIYVYDGDPTSGLLLGEYTGRTLPKNGDPIIATSGSMTILQKTSSKYNRPGFSAKWRSETNAVMSYLSSTTSQTTEESGIGFADQEILMIEVVTRGTGIPAMEATNFNFSLNGTATANISNAKVYYTGPSTVFSTTTEFGIFASAPSSDFSISGTQILSAGKNYFWLVYDVSNSAANGGILDASVNSITLNNTEYIPTETSPAGNRKIKIVESFEDSFPPTDWDITLGSSENLWKKNSSAAKYGLNSISVKRANTGNNEDRYLVTPQVGINSNDNQISFWVKKFDSANSNEGTLLIKVAADKSSTANFTTVTQFDVNSFTSEWEKRTVSLNDHVGTNKYIAFVHQFDGTHKGGLYLDNVVIPAETKDATVSSIPLSDYVLTSSESDFEVLRFRIEVHQTPFQINSINISEMLGASAETYTLKNLVEGRNTYPISNGTAYVGNNYNSIGTYIFSVTADLGNYQNLEKYRFQIAAPSAIQMTNGTLTNTNFPISSKELVYNYNYSISTFSSPNHNRAPLTEAWLGSFTFNTAETKSLTELTIQNKLAGRRVGTVSYSDVDSVFLYVSPNPSSNPLGDSQANLVARLKMNANGTVGGKAEFKGLSIPTGDAIHVVYLLSEDMNPEHVLGGMIESASDVTFSVDITPPTSRPLAYFDKDFTLPVKLESFNIEEKESKIILSIKTATEENAKELIIFRDFENEISEIERIKLRGNYSSGDLYTVIDKNIEPDKTYLYYLAEITQNDKKLFFDEKWDREITTEDIPQYFKIENVYPNPGNPSTSLKLKLPEKARVRVFIYNVLGQKVRIFNSTFEAGKHVIKWNGFNDFGSRVSSGIYFLKTKVHGLKSQKVIKSVQKVVITK
jgi:hypothetical protein